MRWPRCGPVPDKREQGGRAPAGTAPGTGAASGPCRCCPQLSSDRPGADSQVEGRTVTAAAARRQRRRSTPSGVAQPTTDTEATATIPLVRTGAQCTRSNLRNLACGRPEVQAVNWRWITGAVVHTCGRLGTTWARRRTKRALAGRLPPLRSGDGRGRYGRGVRILLPSDDAIADRDPIDLYLSPAREATGRPWVAVNMVCTADGAAVDPTGVSGKLGGDADTKAFGALRSVADVIVAGASTARARRPSSTTTCAPAARTASASHAIPRRIPAKCEEV